MTARQETTRLVKDLRRAGYDVTVGGSGHWKVRDTSGRVVDVISFSPKSGSHLPRLRRKLIEGKLT